MATALTCLCCGAVAPTEDPVEVVVTAGWAQVPGWVCPKCFHGGHVQVEATKFGHKMTARHIPTVVAVAGGWDPLHIGHIAHLRAARNLGNMLIVITHNDEMLVRKKGYVFLPLSERLEILKELRCVSGVFVAEELGDNDGTVTRSLEIIRPQIFAKGGDRTETNMPQSELAICEKLGIKVVYGVGGDKIQSSSELVRAAREKTRGAA